MPIINVMVTTMEARPRASLEAAAPPTRIGWPHWRFAAITAVLTVIACLVATFWLPSLFGLHQWLELGDLRWTVQSAQYVSNGGLGYVYSVNDQFLPLPGFLLLLAPFVGLGDHLGLTNSFPVYLNHPSMWLVVAPAAFVFGSTCIIGVDYLAATLEVTRLRRRVLVIAVGAFVVLPTLCWAGHPEDLLALTFSCFSLALMLRGRHLPAAALLALAVIMQPWALLLIPLLAVSAPPGLRVRSVLTSSLLPAAIGLMLLGLDWHDAARSLIEQPMQGKGQHLPWWSFGHQMIVMQNGLPNAVRVGSGPRFLAVATAVAVAWWIRNRMTPRTVIFAASVALVARGVFETQVWPYYLGPAAVFLGLGAALAPTNRRAVVGGLLAVVFYACVSGAYYYRGWFAPAFLAFAVLLLAAAGSVRAAGLYRTSAAMADSIPFTNFADSSVE